MRKLFVLFVLLFGASASAQEPRLTYKFNDTPPVADYYSRSFVLEGLKPVKDATGRDSDAVLGSNPQSARGFRVSWLQPGQEIGALTKPTTVTMVDGSGNQVKVRLKKGESVVYDGSSSDILAGVRCANKVVEGTFERPQVARAEPSPPPPAPAPPPAVQAAQPVPAQVLPPTLQTYINIPERITLTLVESCEGKACDKYKQSLALGFQRLGLGALGFGGGAGAFMAGHGVMGWGNNTVEAAAARRPDYINVTGNNNPVFNPSNVVQPPVINNTATNTNSPGPITVTANGGQGGAGGQGGLGVGVGTGGNANAGASASAGAAASAGAGVPAPPIPQPPIAHPQPAPTPHLPPVVHNPPKPAPTPPQVPGGGHGNPGRPVFRLPR